MLFALNGFIDNFMVGKYNAVAAISAANQWTNIVNGIVIGVAAAGGVVSAQLFYSRRYQAFKQMARFRYVLTTGMTLVIAILAWIIPDELNSLFLKRPEHLASEEVQYAKNLAMAREYIQITALQWILFSISGNLGIQLREVGKGHVTVYWGVGTLSMNITLNAILIYGFDVGVKGAAWASVAARMVAIIVGFTFVVKTNSQLRFAPWTVFSFDWHTTKLFFARFALFFAYTTMVALVTFRSYFYDMGYPQGSLGQGIGATAVLGLSNAIMNVFTTAFAGVGVMAANFVGSELGNGRIESAKIHSNQLKGFNTSMSVALSVLVVIVASFAPLMTFLVDTRDPNVDTGAQLIEVRNTLYVIALFYPVWIWFTTTYRNGVSGGRTFVFSLTDWLFNLAQIGWAWIVMGPLKDAWPALEGRFWLAYIVFFTSDIFKLIAQEINYYTIDWAQVIDAAHVEADNALQSGHDVIDSEPLDV